MALPPLKCRICWDEKPKENLMVVTTPWKDDASKTIKEIILFCVPAVSIQDDSQICNTCLWQLKFAYHFIERCLKTERILLPNTLKTENIFDERNVDTIKIIIEHENEQKIPKSEEVALETIKLINNDHTYFDSSQINEETNKELKKFNDDDDDDDDTDNNDNFDNDRNEAVKEKPKKTLRKRQPKKSNNSEITYPFPKQMLDILDFDAINMMCLTVESSMSKENHDDLIQHGINVIDMSSGSTEKKRVIYLGRDLNYIANECVHCNLQFETTCDFADHKHFHHKGKIKLPENVGFKCNKCDASFITEGSYRDHYKNIHNSSLAHSCKKCNRKFRTFSELKKHDTFFKDKESCVIKCSKCDKKFSSIEGLQAHEADIADAPCCDYVKCKICHLKFTKEDHKAHLYDHNPEYLCSECGKGFYTSSSLQSHKKNVHVSVRSMCHECGKVIKNDNVLRHHIDTVHGNNSYMCDKCPRQFKSQLYLRKHQLKHDKRQRSFICEKCGKSFYSSNALYQHNTLLHLGSDRHVCPRCGEGFCRKDYLQRHIKYHDKYMQFSCKVCKMSFSTEQRLTTHESHGHDENGKPLYIGRTLSSGFKKGSSNSKMRSRIYYYKYSKKPCVCSICNKILASPIILKMHYKTHLKIREHQHQCEKCEIIFQNYGTWRNHMKLHDNPKFELSCNICHVYCNSRPELQEHIANTHKNLKYHCKYCPSKFGRKFLLYSHEAIKHKEENEKKRKVLNLLTKEKPNFDVASDYVVPKSIKGSKFDYFDTDVDQVIKKIVKKKPEIIENVSEMGFNILSEEYQMQEEVDEKEFQIQTEDYNDGMLEEEYEMITEEEQAARILEENMQEYD